ncbi:MAG TPA: RNA polymerase sigma factor [Pyrinomonadaceae bacterium]|nr:RNA polymerase sigma factor [Pyrinomonadaceae bacterium]
MLEPSEIPRVGERHEEVFLARYAGLRAWALRLTEGDTARAEDLVHDAFVQFTFTRPNLARVQNLDGYLYRMLRNLNISQMRRTRVRREESLAVCEYDSAEFVLRATDPRDSIRVQDDLRQVCRYACLRKESAKAGSVLILRFMHGYYPAEVARVCGSTREAVEERLRVARSEAAQFLKDPSSLRFLAREGALSLPSQPTGFAQTPEELLSDLRRRVFDARRGTCLTKEQLAKLYGEDVKGGPDCATLAHVVSCALCIEAVNTMHGLPPLAERYAVDAIGIDVSRKGGDDKGEGSGGRGGGGDDAGGRGGVGGGDDEGGGDATGGASEAEARRCRRRARDVFEHRPRELRVSVNGRMLAAQKVGAIFNEQKLNVGGGEEVSFVEVFSEQDVRLLYLDPAAWAGEGGECSLSVGLSEGRTLEARLSYVDSAPTVRVAYRDPLMAVEAVREPERVGEEIREEAAAVGDELRGERGALGAAWGWLRELVARLLSPFAALRPGAWAAGLAVLLVTALLFTKFNVTKVSAAELLRRAALAEESTDAGGAGFVVHRTVFVEELKADGRSVASRRRVETWRGSASGIRLRRLYDEQGRLVAGEWTKSDGTGAIYRRGEPPAEVAALTARELLDAGEVWRIEPSARNFSALGAGGDALKVDERLATYVLSYESSSVDEGLVGGSLWLNRSDLRAFRMTLVVRRGGANVEYRLVEGGLERKRTDEVPPGVYQVEPELLGAAGAAGDEVAGARPQRGETAQPAAVVTSPAAVASAELEVEVAYLLNQIKANLGEQVSMGRTTGGALRVDALVESEGRKAAILRALGPVIGNPAVVVEVNTVAEALAKRERAKGEGSNVTEREVSVGAGRIPADAELRAHFGARLADGARVDAEIKQFAARAMGRSRQALLHASALKRLVGRFKPSEAQALEPEARAKWLSMVREHAGAYRREVSALRSQLGTVFDAGGGGAAAEAVGEANVTQAAERLLQLSYAQDGAVRSAFTISEEGGTAASIKSAQFWRTLAVSERLAAAIEEAYER